MHTPHDPRSTLTTLLDLCGIGTEEIELATQADLLLKALSGPHAHDHLHTFGLSPQDGKTMRKDLRDLYKRATKAPDAQDTRVAAWIFAVWGETIANRAPDLADSQREALLGAQATSTSTAMRSLRGVELTLRSLIQERHGTEAELERALGAVFGAQVLARWKHNASGASLVSGTDFGELASLLTSRQLFTRYAGLFEAGDELGFYPDHRVTLTRFLDDIRRIRNVLAHHRRFSSLQEQLLDHCCRAMLVPLQQAHDAGDLGFDPSEHFGADDAALQQFEAALAASEQAVRDDVADLKADLGAVAETVAATHTATKKGARWALVAAAAAVVGGVVTWLNYDRSGRVEETVRSTEERSKDIQATTQNIAAGVSDIKEGVKEIGNLGGVIAQPKSPAEWYRNAQEFEQRKDFEQACACIERAFELVGDRPVDLAREFVRLTSLRVSEVEALPSLIRWLDPQGSRYRIENGVPVANGNAAPHSSLLSVEAALVHSNLVRDDKAVRNWLEPLMSTAREATPVLNQILTSLGSYSQFGKRTNVAIIARSIGHLRDLKASGSLAKLTCLPEGFSKNDTVEPDFEATAAKLQTSLAPAKLVNKFGKAEVQDAYQQNRPLVAGTPKWEAYPGTLKGAWLWQLHLWIPDQVSSATGNGQLYRGISGVWSELNYFSLRLQAAQKSPRLIKFAYASSDGTLTEHELSFDFAQAELAASKERLTTALETLGGRGWLEIDCPPSNEPGRVIIKPFRLIEERHAIQSIAYSLGDASLKEHLEFIPAHLWRREAYGHKPSDASHLQFPTPYPALTRAAAGHEIDKDVIVFPDRFSGPLFLQVVFKDGSQSPVAKCDFVDLEVPPPGWPKNPLRKPEQPASSTAVAPSVLPLAFCRSRVVEKTDKEGRKVVESTIKVGTRQVLHGLQRYFYASGKLRAEALCAEGQCYAYAEWDENGQLRSLSHFAPSWDLDDRCTEPPTGRSLYGPLIRLTSDGEFDPNADFVSGDYGDLDRDTPWSNGRQRHQNTRRDLSQETIDKLRNIRSLEDLLVTVEQPPIRFRHVFHTNDLRVKGISWNPTPELNKTGGYRMAPGRGRGLLVEGIPFGWWQELDENNRVTAQGWVHHHARKLAKPTKRQLNMLEQRVQILEKQLAQAPSSERVAMMLKQTQEQLQSVRTLLDQSGLGSFHRREAVRCGRWITYSEGGLPAYFGHYSDRGTDYGLFAKVAPDGALEVAMTVIDGSVRTHLSDEDHQRLFDEELPLLVGR
jgi:hypothetical protein